MDTSEQTSQAVPVEYESYDPATSAPQVARRDFTGDIPSTGETIDIRCWAIAFQQHPQSRAKYRKFEGMLSTVNELGYVPVKLDDVPGVMFSSLSERTDLLGEFTTIWITSVDRGSNKRGATLACLNGAIVHLIATSIYEADGDDRAHVLVEHLAARIGERAPEMLMANEVDEPLLVERLPTIEEVAEVLDNADIISDSYVRNTR